MIRDVIVPITPKATNPKNDFFAKAPNICAHTVRRGAQVIAFRIYLENKSFYINLNLRLLTYIENFWGK